ncbi:MAG: NPXTG-anchored protein [Clostridia bacterium]|nr:NPXTG-anchored protein [Clostridia bacterium]
MKIAKKLLAAVVAVMLVCSLTVCAFAAQSAETGDVALSSDWKVSTRSGKDYIAVKVLFVEAEELQSWNLTLKYDADIFNFMSNSAGKDAKAVTAYCEQVANQFTDVSNPNVDGEINVGGYFKATLWSAEKFLENSNMDGDCIVDSENFEATVFYLEVEDAKAFEEEDITITIEGTMTFGAKAAEGEESTQVSTTVDAELFREGTGAEEESSSNNEEESSSNNEEESSSNNEEESSSNNEEESSSNNEEESSSNNEEESSSNNEEESSSKEDEDASRPITDDDDCRPGKPGHDNCKPNKPCVKPGKPGHNHPNTGDSAALAAAAGVVLLAGAAFVVSKKRK